MRLKRRLVRERSREVEMRRVGSSPPRLFWEGSEGRAGLEHYSKQSLVRVDREKRDTERMVGE